MKIPRKIPVIAKYLLMNARTLAVISGIIALVMIIMVFFGLHISVLAKSETVLILLFFPLFSFLFVGLFRGVRLQKEHPQSLYGIKKSIENTTLPDIPVPTTSIEGGDDPISLIFSLFIAVFLLFYLLWAGFYIAILLLIALYFIFYMAYRLVFRHSRETKGDITRSFGIALSYTLLYLGMFFIFIEIIKYFKH